MAESRNHPPEDDCCPICLDSFQFPCQTNCGHWYCGSCFVSYWKRSEEMKLCNCPICGRLVKNLTPYSSHWFSPQIFITAYNYQYVFIFLANLFTLLYDRLLPPDDDKNTRLALFLRVFSDLFFVFGLALLMSRFGIISHWLAEMLLVTPLRHICIVCASLLICIECDKVLFRPRRRARRLAEEQDLFSDDD